MTTDTQKNKALHPNIFEYTDYRAFLRDCYIALKKNAPYFSYRYFAKAAGFNTSNFYKLVADGKRNLSSDGAEKFAKALKFNPREARYFKLLVLQNQAQTPQEKDFFLKQILRTGRVKNLKPLSQAQYDYYSRWFLLALRELVARSDFKNDPHWIATQFIPSISAKEASEGLATLIKLDLVKQRDDGCYEQTHTVVTSKDNLTGQAIVNYHQEMIRLGIDAITRFPAHEREISTLTIGASAEKVQKIKKMIQEFQNELMHELQTTSTVEKVVQLNFQLFPLTRPYSQSQNNNK